MTDTKIKVYLAARFSRRHELNEYAHELQKRGFEITSRWVKPDTDHLVPAGMSEQAADKERQRFAVEDVSDVYAGDWCISFTEIPRNNSRGGRHVEFGMAYGYGNKCFTIGPRETVFHHLPRVMHFDDWAAFLVWLDDQKEGE